MTAVLVDTNVLVYAHDRGEPEKQARAIDVLAWLEDNHNGRLSVQMLAEFFSVTTHGQPPKLTLSQATQQVERLALGWPVLPLTPQIILEAVRGVQIHQFAYWDAQIWATARLNQIPVVFSEDFNIGSALEGVRFVNPFAPEFVLENWA